MGVADSTVEMHFVCQCFGHSKVSEKRMCVVSSDIAIANVEVTCFLFGRGSYSGCFPATSGALKTLLKGSMFRSFGGVFYKTNTLVNSSKIANVDVLPWCNNSKNKHQPETK